VQAILHMLTGLLSALVYLERFGVLHRDIKADNCLIVGDEPHFTAKLIDFGLAKKFDRHVHNVPMFGLAGEEHEIEEEEAADDEAAAAAGPLPATPTPAAPRPSPNVQSKTFNKEQQYAPEALDIEAHRGGLEHQFTHDSDLWAIGSMILWPLMYLACKQNLQKDLQSFFSGRGKPDYAKRMFPFECLWGASTPKRYERGEFSQRNPNVPMTLGNLIFEQLLQKFSSPEQAATDEDKALFERICRVCSFMCAHNPQHRKIDPDSPLSAAQQCLDFLQGAGAPPPPPPAAAAAPDMVDSFDPVCKFIDNFCASGHYSGTAKVLGNRERWREVQFKIAGRTTKTVYEQSGSQSWLLVNGTASIPKFRDAQFQGLTYDDCLTPDYCVLPCACCHVHSSIQPRAIFLPRNKFCRGADGTVAGMFDVSRLTLLTQRDWFTVFRYNLPGGAGSWIIKSVATSTRLRCAMCC
jgi:serine/threonine protein kinase